MPDNENFEFYDVAIIGAGPAGCCSALALKDAGFKVLLIDKSDFPRDKVCGDAIPGRAIKTLKSISPVYEQAFKQFREKLETKNTKLYYNGKEMVFEWVREAYTCTRLAFDNFLINLVKAHTNTTIITNATIIEVARGNENIIFSTTTNKRFKTKFVVGADGAHSVVAKKLTGKIIDRVHHAASVRAYYTNVANLAPDTTNIYFHKKYLPSYLWVFPLPNNRANVGIGMQSNQLIKKKINLRKIFYEFIDNTPELALTFKDAKQVGDLEGFGLPLGSATIKISGNRFILTGDAASLIDPATGDGIGNAMLSGKLAAETIINCFKKNDFSSDFVRQYDEAVIKAIGKELKTHYRLQRILTKFPLLLTLAFWLYNNKFFKIVIKKML